MNKKLPSISFKGKEYVTVAERVRYFNEEYKKGSIRTELVSPVDADRVIIKATVWPGDSDRYFTGYSQAKWSDTQSFVNKMSALENAETSAVGRALALMGIGLTDSIASIDEINKANQTIKKIESGEKFTADEYEQAVQVDAPMAFSASKEASHKARDARPKVFRNGVGYQSKQTIAVSFDGEI